MQFLKPIAIGPMRREAPPFSKACSSKHKRARADRSYTADARTDGAEPSDDFFGAPGYLGAMAPAMSKVSIGVRSSEEIGTELISRPEVVEVRPPCSDASVTE
jgi:hypothetical protein